jgi:hypothetical protein
MMRRLAIGVFVVVLSGCTYPRTKMEPVNPTTSDGAQQAADRGKQR